MAELNSPVNLAGELISEMQRNNPPNVFNVEGSINSNESSTPATINPDLQKSFMYVLKQSPHLQQKFQNPQELNKVLQNPNDMMNVIHEYQQQNKMDADSSQELQDPQRSQEPQTLGNNESIQYEDDETDLPLALQSNKEGNWKDRLLNDLRGPIIATILYIILTQQAIRDLIFKWIPQVQNRSILQTVIMAVIMLILSYSFKKIVDFFI